MELLEGQSLREWMAVAAPERFGEALDILCAAGRGLVCAHDCGVVHRDLKPANVHVGIDGRVSVVDFARPRPTRTRRHVEARSQLRVEIERGNPEALAASTLQDFEDWARSVRRRVEAGPG